MAFGLNRSYYEYLWLFNHIGLGHQCAYIRPPLYVRRGCTRLKVVRFEHFTWAFLSPFTCIGMARGTWDSGWKWICLSSHATLKYCTEMRFILCTWFGEFCSCCSLTALPGPAWVLLKWICKELISSLYISTMNLPRPSPLLKLGATVVPNTVTPASIAECAPLTIIRRIMANFSAIAGFKAGLISL